MAPPPNLFIIYLCAEIGAFIKKCTIGLNILDKPPHYKEHTSCYELECYASRVVQMFCIPERVDICYYIWRIMNKIYDLVHYTPSNCCERTTYVQ